MLRKVKPPMMYMKPLRASINQADDMKGIKMPIAMGVLVVARTR